MAKAQRSIPKITGWGADLDPANRPAVPKEKTSDVMTARGPALPRQVPTVKILKSTEQPDLTPVFGTACPPAGLSGRIREYAYTFSEGRLAHWFALMLADRIDVIEGLARDLGRGHIPNLLRERGWKAELTHSSPARRRRVLLMTGTGAAILGGLLLFARRARRASRAA